MNRVISSGNEKFKRLKGLDRKKVRESENLFFVEGWSMVHQALEAGFSIREIYVSEQFLGKQTEVCRQLEAQGLSLNLLSDSLMRQVMDTITPQGILAEVARKHWDEEHVLSSSGPFMVLDGVADPGNVGTIVRTCEAFGFRGVFALDGCADIYNPKTIRATMGSMFRIPYIRTQFSLVSRLKKEGIQMVGASLDGAPLDEWNVSSQRVAVIIGNEARGLTPEAKALCHRLIRISMTGEGGALNASIAAGILCHHIYGFRRSPEYP